MKRTKYFAILTFCLLAFATQAQKFGYINSTQLLLEMPEVKAADVALETYQKQLIGKGETMVKAFEKNYQAYVAEANEGGLSKIQMQQREGDLGIEQQNIQKYELEVQQKLAAKRETLYKPILEKVKTAVDGVGADGGYTMIFDSSTGTILHAMESEDVMGLVKAKLGI